MIVARWESRSGKHWVDIDCGCETGYYGYRSPAVCGGLAATNAVDAVKELEPRITMGMFQPDAITTPMRRVR